VPIVRRAYLLDRFKRWRKEGTDQRAAGTGLRAAAGAAAGHRADGTAGEDLALSFHDVPGRSRMEEAMKTARNVRWSGAMVSVMNHAAKKGPFAHIPRSLNRTALHLERLGLVVLDGTGRIERLAMVTLTANGQDFMANNLAIFEARGFGSLKEESEMLRVLLDVRENDRRAASNLNAGEALSCSLRIARDGLDVRKGDA